MGTQSSPLFASLSSHSRTAPCLVGQRRIEVPRHNMKETGFGATWPPIPPPPKKRACPQVALLLLRNVSKPLSIYREWCVVYDKICLEMVSTLHRKQPSCQDVRRAGARSCIITRWPSRPADRDSHRSVHLEGPVSSFFTQYLLEYFALPELSSFEPQEAALSLMAPDPSILARAYKLSCEQPHCKTKDGQAQIDALSSSRCRRTAGLNRPVVAAV